MNLPAIDFHAHHSPLGAWFSFTCGAHGEGGGFGLESGAIPQQRLYIGWAEDEVGPIHVLPFLQEAAGADPLAAFTPEAARKDLRQALRRIPGERVRRDYGFATDRFRVDDFSFALFTPVQAAPEPGVASVAAERASLLPAIAGELTFDNRSGTKDITLVFGMDGLPSAGLVQIDRPDAIGWSFKNQFGLAMPRLPGARVRCAWGMAESLQDWRRFHIAGTLPSLLITVPKGERLCVPLAFGCHRPGRVTEGIDLRYRYADHFAGIGEVLAECLARHGELSARAARQDAWHAGSGLSADRQHQISHATRSYYGSTQLLMRGQDPVWVVNEGEYAMVNTFDLVVDQVFLENALNPWVQRNVLDMYVERYAYMDQVVDPVTKAPAPGGIAFTHDMGVMNVWSPAGISIYEVSHHHGCFSFMSAEELINWVLCATSYVTATGDEAWLRARAPVLGACLASLLNRDHADPAQRTGLVQFDGARCVTGSEITTYDSLDASLGQARNNLYLGLKAWAAYLGLELLGTRLGDAALCATAQAQARRAAATIAGRFDPALGYIPAVFEGGNRSAIIPGVEGLIHPLQWGLRAALDPQGPYGALITALGTHLTACLKPGVCLQQDGGWQLSSTSKNTWPSKIAICAQVATGVYGIPVTDPRLATGDAVHLRWELVGSRTKCATDQIVDGIGVGARYYPRLITNWLWLGGALPPA
jgi:hypothetical protein